MRKTFLILTAACLTIATTSTAWAGAPKPPSPCNVTTWDLTKDWLKDASKRIPVSSKAPVVPDGCGNAVWSLIQSQTATAADPSTYRPLDYFAAGYPTFACYDATNKLMGWESNVSAGSPLVIINATGLAQNCNDWAWITVPAGAIDIHPSPSTMGGVSWTSPFTGAARVDVSFADLDPWGTGYGGFTWALQHNASVLLERSVPNAGTDSFSTQVNLVAGEKIYLMIGPDGNYYYDSTQVSIKITKL